MTAKFDGTRRIADEPAAWWADTMTYGTEEGCSRPFWLKHDAEEYARKHGGFVSPLYRKNAFQLQEATVVSLRKISGGRS